MPATTSKSKRSAPKAGLAFWMDRVLEECTRAGVDFAPNPVHDLRTALRRCRSLADGLMTVDPDPELKRMKKAGKRLFSSLGQLRDTHVMQEWVHHFDSPGDPVASRLLEFLATRESQSKEAAAQALREFDRKQWRKWSHSLPRRTARLRPGNAVFQHVALERWTEAHELHRRALRNRSQTAWHELRIGLKRLRYIVENFLPELHQRWGRDLKQLQDLLGEVHDLDVLRATAQQIEAFPDDESRARWNSRISAERDERIAKYREKMVGPSSLWQVWRRELPQGEAVEEIAIRRLKLWASFLDPDFRHSSHVARLALQLYDGLVGKGETSANGWNRKALHLAALMHDVGRGKEGKGHHKAGARMILKLPPPLGVDASLLRLAGAVSRYHRGAFPRGGQKIVSGLNSQERSALLSLAGMLRLANAFDAERDGRIQRLKVQPHNGVTLVLAKGYGPRDRMAENIAAGRHLLELAYRRPLMVKAMPSPKRRAPRPQR